MKRLLFSIYTSLLVRLQNLIVGMKFFNLVLVSFIFSALFFCSCNEPTILGADLVEGEQGQIQIVDTFKISMETIVGDTVVGFDPDFVNYSNYLFGDFDDPVFGKSTASLSFRIGGPGFYPDFDEITRADSIVLVLPYDTSGFYGNTKQLFSFDLLDISERMDGTATYNTDTTIMTDPMIFMENISFVPNGVDSIEIITSNTDDQEDSVKVAPQLRIKLNDSYMDRIVNADSLTYESDSIFLDIFKGFQMKPKDATNGMVSFDMVDPTAGIYLYYHTSDSTFETFQFRFNRVIVPSYTQTTAGSPVQTFRDDQVNTDSIHFVQGMKGLGVKMTLPDLSSLGDVIINRAEIELTLASLPDDDISLYSPTEQLILSYALDSSGNSRVPVDDVSFAGTSIDNIQEWFGGNIVTGSSGNVQTYKMSIASHLQRVLDGEINNFLYLQPYLRSQFVARAAFKGANAKENPAKLKIFYTETTK